MRGADEQPGSMFSYVSLEERVPADVSLACASCSRRQSSFECWWYRMFPWAVGPSPWGTI